MPSKAEIVDFLAREFPQSKCVVDEVGHRSKAKSELAPTRPMEPD
jgi:hypothetical protein